MNNLNFLFKLSELIYTYLSIALALKKYELYEVF